MSVTVVETIAELRSLLAGRTAALVPTMGALHDGHLALVTRAAGLADAVVVSIFVNPLQFGPGEDLDRYPRSLADDVAKLDAAGVEFVFAPSAAEMYPTGPIETRVTAGTVGTLFEGRTRPGHFDGVLTVVAKLLGIVRPAFVVVGQKDAQQVYLVQRMVRDLDFETEVTVVETVREQNGLALSSRNHYLDEREKRAALALSAALDAAHLNAGRGVGAALAAANSVLRRENLVTLDYLAAVDPDTFVPVDDDHRGRARVLIAAKVGDTRLIDNQLVHAGV